MEAAAGRGELDLADLWLGFAPPFFFFCEAAGERERPEPPPLLLLRLLLMGRADAARGRMSSRKMGMGCTAGGS